MTLTTFTANPTFLWIVVAGVVAGLIHVFSGPDHLAAIAPLAVKRQRRAWLTGLRWGTGHASGVATVGGLSLLFRSALPQDLISSFSDRLVGLVLVIIGLWTLRRATLIHSHEHVHEGRTHLHIHWHGRDERAAHDASKPHSHPHAAFGIGILHGFSGSSHFLAVIPSLLLPTAAMAVGYLAAFGLGTVLAMMLFASVIHSSAMRFAGVERNYRRLLFVCAAMAIMVGGVWLAGFGF